MTLRTCPRRAEVELLLANGYWPHACPDDLRAHLSECRFCAELLLLTEGFQSARAASFAQANLPAPGLLWWRAELRRRNAAVDRVSRPITSAYIFALAVVVLAAAVSISGEARQGMRWATWLPQSQSFAAVLASINPVSLHGTSATLAVLAALLGTLVMGGALAVYFGTELP